MRLIDGDALIKKAHHEAKGMEKSYEDFGVLVEWLVDKIPTIEPERKKGKWIPVDSYSAYGGDESTWMAHGNPIAFYYCSECKEQTYADENGDSILSKFCPNCGADMRECEQE